MRTIQDLNKEINNLILKFKKNIINVSEALIMLETLISDFQILSNVETKILDELKYELFIVLNKLNALKELSKIISEEKEINLMYKKELGLI
ncbi:hypothetical protein TM902_140061 [Tenacibaculum maritimum]|uniref:hypothetical protein n=1 Tax=Tenacibaculum maritimum TaxID=107401 RepID=UPI0012E5F72B|nr:hypothetical protein [Tenacibaculum maritimum]CAA0144308.1 hypothetical protein TM902_140061 [Tenacibaculum maritimum]CAA0196173.1 hypothetical protein JIP32914_220024 [Tenacibaculum maritimum]